jgi:carbon starvation protein CstA
MRSERQARSSFYGMMVLEGFIAMVWAAAALAVFNIMPETMKLAAPVALGKIVDYFLGTWVGGVTVLSVIILAITSGDTALRSCRLSLSEKLHIDQKPLFKRFIVCVPMIVAVSLLLWWSNQDAKSFNMLWNYFAWANQVIAVCTLLAATVYLSKLNKPTAITLVPGLFMLFITCSYLLSSKTLGAPVGLSIPLNISYIIAGAFACCAGVWAEMRGKKLQG